MSIDALLSKVKQPAGERAAALESEFWRLARDVAAGTEADPSEVAELLERSSKTADQFAAAVRLMVDRPAWAEAVAGEPAADEQWANMKVEINNLYILFNKAEAAHIAAREPFEATVIAAHTASRAAGDAKDMLRTTCPYATVLDKKKALAVSVKAAEVAVKEWQGRVSRVRVNADHVEVNPGLDYRESAARAKERLPVVERELADRVAERDKLVRDLERAEADCLTP